MIKAYTRDKVIVSATEKTVEKDGKKNKFIVYTGIFRKYNYTVKFTTYAKNNINIDIVDGGKYVIEKPVYNYDDKSVYRTVWIKAFDNIHEFTDDDIELVEEKD